MARDFFAGTRAVRRARKNAVMAYLAKHRDRPVPAIELAEAARVAGESHESKRRRVRELITELRDDGSRICAGHRADGGEGCELGYWLARDDGEWRQYTEARRSRAKFEFVAVRKMRTAACEERTGQGKLFDDCRWGIV